MRAHSCYTGFASKSGEYEPTLKDPKYRSSASQSSENARLIREMRRRPEIDPILVHAGQHYNEKLSDIFSRLLGIPMPNLNLEVGSGSHAFQTAEVLKRIEPALLEYKPDVLIVAGDVDYGCYFGFRKAGHPGRSRR